jgi:type II secretory pathway predicted ATPase ExeA
MYKTFFGLKRLPFLFVPDVESCFSVESREESRREIEHAIKKGEGFSLIFGASGTGKTLLLRLIQQSLESEYTVAFVSHSRLETPRALFLQLFHDLHLSASGGETIELRLQLLDFARQEHSQGVVLLFDDAQYLSPSVLEEIRLLTDSADGSAPLFRAVLAGTMDFEEKLTLPHLEVLNQRVASRCYLDSFSNEETSQYIVWQTDHLRIDPPHQTPPPLFTEEAKRRIYQLTDGVPRLINKLCGTSLQFAADRKVKSIDGSLVNAAWLNLHHLESDDVPEQTDSSSVQGPVISPEQIEEIIARKKKTFQIRQFDPVEFGILSDSETVETEVSGTYRSLRENEYKPPYPEDDEEVAELEAAEPEVLSLSGVPAIVPKCPLLPSNFDQQHRKCRRRYLLQKIRHRLGLFASVLRKIESSQPGHSTHESSMNEKSLQEYGATVLDGRPPFVRKEPFHAYQTTPMASQNDVAYPDPKTGVPIALHWFSEKTGENGRFGVSYTEFLNRDQVESPIRIEAKKSDVPCTPNVLPKSAEPAALIVRTSLNTSHEGQTMLPHHSGLEECFEESQQVGGSAISLAELFRVDSRRIETSAEFQSLDAAVQRQLEAVIRRITKAAEKIEQVAEVSERAGQHISEAAEFVETEVRSAVPTYTDLFRQWSEFQEKITAELESAQRRNPEPPQCRTFPRRQVVIERAVPTIDVESLLR